MCRLSKVAPLVQPAVAAQGPLRAAGGGARPLWAGRGAGRRTQSRGGTGTPKPPRCRTPRRPPLATRVSETVHSALGPGHTCAAWQGERLAGNSLRSKATPPPLTPLTRHPARACLGRPARPTASGAPGLCRARSVVLTGEALPSAAPTLSARLGVSRAGEAAGGHRVSETRPTGLTPLADTWLVGEGNARFSVGDAETAAPAHCSPVEVHRSKKRGERTRVRSHEREAGRDAAGQQRSGCTCGVASSLTASHAPTPVPHALSQVRGVLARADFGPAVVAVEVLVLGNLLRNLPE